MPGLPCFDPIKTWATGAERASGGGGGRQKPASLKAGWLSALTGIVGLIGRHGFKIHAFVQYAQWDVEIFMTVITLLPVAFNP
jgi:hypothetical protein